MMALEDLGGPGSYIIRLAHRLHRRDRQAWRHGWQWRTRRPTRWTAGFDGGCARSVSQEPS